MSMNMLMKTATLVFFIMTAAPTPADALSPSPSRRTRIARSTNASPLKALIYGWDDVDDDDSSAGGSSTSTGKPLSTYFDVDTTYSTHDDYGNNNHYNNDSTNSYTWGTACSTSGTALAESLSIDRDRTGSLARLAVAFSPPDRQLALDAIQSIDVICVTPTHIDLQAMVCDGTGGCVSLAVPVKFPQACGDSLLEACVVQNLDRWDEEHAEQAASAGWNTLVEYPAWWVEAVDSSNPLMPAECDYMTSILNEDEFQPELVALAQTSLNQAANASPGSVFPTMIQHAKVVKMGPGGMLFQCRGGDINSPILNVFSPFSNGPMHSIETLRAAVLGSVAMAGA